MNTPSMRHPGSRKRFDQIKDRVVELREQGMAINDIAKEIRCNHKTVRKALNDSEILAERKRRAYESLLFLVPFSLDAVRYQVEVKKDGDLGLKVLQALGVVGRDVTNIQINAHQAIIPINQDMIDAARAVAEQMRAVVTPKLLQQQKEENSNGNSANTVTGEPGASNDSTNPTV